MGQQNSTTKKKSWKQLSDAERYKIEGYLELKMSPTAIAEKLGRDRRTIEREIARGMVTLRDTNWKDYTTYKAYHSQVKRNCAASMKGAPPKLSLDKKLAEYIQKKIVQKKFSPDAVLAEIRNKKLTFSQTICTKTLYNCIDKGLIEGLSNKNLPVKRTVGKKRGYRRLVAWNNTKGDSIDNRQKEPDSRIALNWEADCVVSGRGSRSCLLVLTERYSRYELIFKMEAQTQACVIDVFNRLEIQLGDNFSTLFKTITFDNGKEFLDWKAIETSVISPDKKRTKTYFCHPYSSWERGSNEVANRLIRRFIKKGSDISLSTNEDIKYIQNWMNDYPRKIFGYRSAKQIFLEFTNGKDLGI